jgi:hypothetical protein
MTEIIKKEGILGEKKKNAPRSIESLFGAKLNPDILDVFFCRGGKKNKYGRFGCKNSKFWGLDVKKVNFIIG